MRGAKVTCRLQKNIAVATGTGSTASWSTVTTFRGALLPVSQSEQNLADKETEFKDHTLMFGKNAVPGNRHDEINGRNRIQIGAKYYDIRGAAQHPGRGKYWKVRLRDVTEQTDT